MLHGELVGTNSPQTRNLFIKGCSPSRASLLRGYCFRLGNRVGSRRTMMTSSAWWACPGIPWSHTWGLILSSHSLCSLFVGEGVMGSSVVTSTSGKDIIFYCIKAGLKAAQQKVISYAWVSAITQKSNENPIAFLERIKRPSKSLPIWT